MSTYRRTRWQDAAPLDDEARQGLSAYLKARPLGARKGFLVSAGLSGWATLRRALDGRPLSGANRQRLEAAWKAVRP